MGCFADAAELDATAAAADQAGAGDATAAGSAAEPSAGPPATTAHSVAASAFSGARVFIFLLDRSCALALSDPGVCVQNMLSTVT